MEPDVLYQLSVALNKRLDLQKCDHTLRFVRMWCRAQNIDEWSTVKYLLSRGGDCDCKVLAIASQVETVKE